MVSAPVTYYEAFIIPHIPEYGHIDIGIGAGVFVIDCIIGIHDTAHTCLHCGFKGSEICLMKSLLTYDNVAHVEGHSVGTCISHKVLAHSSGVIFFYSSCLLLGKLGSKEGICSHLILCPVEMRVTCDVEL